MSGLSIAALLARSTPMSDDEFRAWAIEWDRAFAEFRRTVDRTAIECERLGSEMRRIANQTSMDGIDCLRDT